MTLARPGAEAASLASTKRNTTSIYLDPLPPEPMERLLTGLVPGLPDEITAKILERAEGVPLYVVETVRMLLDRGLLVQEGPVYRPTGPIEDLQVPETLQALIAARLDGLTPDERRVVQDAAVLGKTFTRSALAAMTGLSERELEPVLASLVAKEVLSIQADPRSPERGQHGFLQDLVRTVAYDTLSKRDRKQKHLQAAAYLEGAWGDEEEEIVEVVASHFLEAYGLAPDAEDAPRIRDQARRMLVRAAERAESLAAAEEAEGYFVQAARLTDSSLERAELVERAGAMALFGVRATERPPTTEEASSLYEEAGQSHSAARAESRLAGIEFLRNQVEQATERMARAYAALSGDEPDADRAVVAHELGRLLAISGRQEEALPLVEEALRLAEHLELRELYAQALSSRAIGLEREDRLDEAATLLRRALEVSLEHGFTGAAFRAYNNLAVALESMDRFEEMLEITERALELARRTGDRVQELSWLAGSLGTVVVSGRRDQAIAWGEEALAAEELDSLEWVAAGPVDLATLLVHRGDLERARSMLERFADRSAVDNPELHAIARCAEAELLRAQGRPAEALAAAEEGVAAREFLGLASQAVNGR